MSALAKLKLIAAVKPSVVSPVIQRRQKLAARLAEQIELAKAQAEGRSLVLTRKRRTKSDTGEFVVAEAPKRVQTWWWAADGGKLALSIRYGAKLLELAKGKNAIELSSEKDLLPALTTIKVAVESGELDAQLGTLCSALQAGFKK